MEGLRDSLLVPAGASVAMVMGSIVPMIRQAFMRGGLKDDNGKPIFSTPYKPWEVPTKHENACDDLYRAHKAAENIKEWTFHVIPLMWVFSIFGGGIPYVSEGAVEGAVALSTATWLFGCYKYFKGYHKAAKDRQTGFLIRFVVVFFWLSGSAVGLGCAGWNRMK